MIPGSILFLSLFLVILSVDGNCRYRNVGNFPESVFSVYADFGCYNYNQDKFFINGGLSEIITACTVNGYKVPGIILKDKCQVFHHNNTLIHDLVRESFVSEVYFERWIDCCEDALRCCREIAQENEQHEQDRCPAIWDGWTCFRSAEAGSFIENACPIYAYSGQGPQCTHYSQKECFSNGTWSVRTNYATCAINQRLITRTKWHMAMLGISLAICLPALAIFFFYKDLKTLKFILIRNLILAIVIRSILVIMSKRLIILDELVNEKDTVISENGVPCRVLAFFEKLAANAVFTCMLLEAIHLHSLLTKIFECRTSPSGINMTVFYIGGAAMSLLAALSWAIAMAVANDQYCWVVTDGTDFQWINDTPRLLMLAINFILLLHIMLSLRCMFKENPNERSKGNYIQRLAKISLICLPLFGVPFLFVAIRPNTESCAWEQFYYFISYALEGLQGIFVALLHCFMNREVRCTLRESWWKIREYLPDNIKERLSASTTWDSGRERRTTVTSSGGEYSSRKPSLGLTRCPTIPEEEIRRPYCDRRTISVDTTSTWSYRDDGGFESFDMSPQQEPELPETMFPTSGKNGRGNGRSDSQA